MPTDGSPEEEEFKKVKTIGGGSNLNRQGSQVNSMQGSIEKDRHNPVDANMASV